jgi:hypothetical protein
MTRSSTTTSRLVLLLLAASCGGTIRAGSASPPAPTPSPAGDVTVHLEKQALDPTVISFAVPVPRATLSDAAQVRVMAGASALDAQVKPLLYAHDRAGRPTDVLSVLIQFPATQMPGKALDVQIAWRGGSARSSAPIARYASVSHDAEVTADTATLEVAKSGESYRLVRGPVVRHALFTGREPNVLATFPDGYLARTEIFGHQAAASELKGDVAGLQFLSRSFVEGLPAALYLQPFPLNPDPASFVDPRERYDVWLYDRCTTVLLGYVHSGDVRFLQNGYRFCSFYESKIGLTGDQRGYFTLKPQLDSKYSHSRGLYAYYALTGDEAAYEAIQATADRTLADEGVVGPYRKKKLRGKDKLWTERELAVAMENLVYGHRTTGDVRYLEAFRELLDTTFEHITADRAALGQLTGWDTLVPQNCLVHGEEQHEGFGGGEPFCSPWMSALLIDPLLRHQAETDDPRIDEIFVRLGRYVRDVGSMYMTGDPSNDSFLNPRECFARAQPGSPPPRRLVPTYGGGRRADGTIARTGEEYTDMDHCPDVSALSAAALRSLKRRPELDQGRIGLFSNELASLIQLHHELAYCAEQVLAADVRPARDPARWTDGARLKEGFQNGDFATRNKIGFPVHSAALERHFSWWFNSSLMQFSMLREVGLAFPALEPGMFKPCP